MLARPILRLALLVALSTAMGNAALADGLKKTFGGPRFFDPAAGGSPCYLRNYSADHLSRHSDQQVTAMGLALMPEARDETVLIVYVKVRSDAETYVASAYCTPKAEGLDCLLEGDAGKFGVTAAKNGALLLSVAARGISFEGSRDFLTLEGTRGDDRDFLLSPSGGETCARLLVSGELN
jgi:hypothetical protein